MSGSVASARDTLFIADLHLDPSRPEVTALALDFLRHARGARALWVIGDLFEAWLGDDIPVPPGLEPIVPALESVAASGTGLHLMHGNRDFLLGGAFAGQVRAMLHREDECTITLGDDVCLVLHGDTLCTDDVAYQGLRTTLRDPGWQTAFLAKSPAERFQLARELRDRSREAVAGKPGEIMDVCAASVTDTFARSGCRLMVHGHTHRPDEHVDSAAGTRRVVVGDWHADHARFARHDGRRLTLETWRPASPP